MTLGSAQLYYFLFCFASKSIALQLALLPYLSAKMVSIQDSSPSFFENAQNIPVDAIFQVQKDFLADSDPKKVNLGPGAYRDENGKPWILPSVQMATTLVANCGHEYLPIAGSQVLREEAVKLVFNGTKPYSEGRVRFVRPELSHILI